MNSLCNDMTVSTAPKSLTVVHRRKNKSMNMSTSYSLCSSEMNVENGDIDSELLYLHKQYIKSKQNRKKSEMDYKLLSNKVKLLLNEESKIKAKTKLAEYLCNKNEKLKVQRVKSKNIIVESKIKIEEKIRELRNQSKYIKKERESSLKSLRTGKESSQREMLSKIKNERKREYEIYLENKQRDLNKKREMVKLIQQQRSHSIELKKQGEYNKKIQMKKQLLQKIIDEENKKAKYEEGVANYQNESVDIMNRIKEITDSLPY